MKIIKQKPIEFNNKANANFEDWQLEQAILWKSQVLPVCRLKTVFMYGRYPAISIHGDKFHIHRLLVSWFYKRNLKREEYVHHKDGNTSNAKLGNLELIDSKKHQSITNKGRKQTPEWIHKRISKTANARRGKKYPRIHKNPELIK